MQPSLLQIYLLKEETTSLHALSAAYHYDTVRGGAGKGYEVRRRSGAANGCPLPLECVKLQDL